MNHEKVTEELSYMDQEKHVLELKEMILDAARRCRNCNYCIPSCPLFISTRGFMSQSPSGIMQAIRYAILWDMFETDNREDLRDLLYLCTTCNSCVLRCKSKATATPILDVIKAGRKLLLEMMIGPLPEQRRPLKDIYGRGNPYGESPQKRLDWLGDIEVKRLPHDTAEVLYFVGCTTAYEYKLHGLGRNLVRLLQALKVDFGVLENEECCGEPARRLGDEALFHEMVSRNVEQFIGSGVTTLITTSPHCFSAFLNEYPFLADKFKIQHYTQFLADHLKKNAPKFKKTTRTITYHDPCYLGKHNQVFEPPREILQMIPGFNLIEMPMTREDSLCCGGGGGRMYAEVEDEPRLAQMRVRQALEVGAEILVTACPWCHTMLQNAAEDLDLMEKAAVKDIADILCETLDFANFSRSTAG
jgi:Fe-S oxidoreductase